MVAAEVALHSVGQEAVGMPGLTRRTWPQDGRMVTDFPNANFSAWGVLWERCAEEHGKNAHHIVIVRWRDT